MIRLSRLFVWTLIFCALATASGCATTSADPDRRDSGDAAGARLSAADAPDVPPVGEALLPLALTRATPLLAPPARPTRTATPTATAPDDTPVPSTPTETAPTMSPTVTAVPTKPARQSRSRGYLTTPEELAEIKRKAEAGVEPYASAVALVIDWADKSWSTSGLKATVKCSGADSPKFMDEEKGNPVIYAKALAYHLTGEAGYADDVARHLERIMVEVRKIDYEDEGGQCQLNFGWGTPELVAAADLIEDYWADRTCSGPTGTVYGEDGIGTGPCKRLFQNWLVKNPYYVFSETTVARQSNWGAAATNAAAYVADYLWDRPEVRLAHRQPKEIDGGRDLALSPAEAYALANKLAIDRSNGYRLEYVSDSSCDVFEGDGQSPAFPPVKSQITENGIIPEDARREEFCNIPRYNGEYQNYPQIHIGNMIQQCELMLRRGDASCYENIDMTDLPSYTFPNPDHNPDKAPSLSYTTHLRPGRGSVERAINAIIIDARTDVTEWKHEAALDVAYRYYRRHSRFGMVDAWQPWLKRPASGPDQDICFGTLTHGYAPGESPAPPPTVDPPRD